MAYHLESLIKVIEMILSHDHHRNFFQQKAIKQIESLLEKVCFLRDSFAVHAILSDDASACFEDQIRDAAQNAEDVLETYVAFSATTQHKIPPPDLQKLLETFDSAKDEMANILDGAPVSGDTPLPAVASRTDQNPKDIVVGVTDDLLQLKDRVVGDSDKLEIVPIVGMGGIGKTTLARRIHNDSSVVSHFDVRAWTTVSEDYSLRSILLDLLSCMPGRRRDEMIGKEDSKLGVTLHQCLMGRRYLIVLDDIWRSKAWDDVKKFFPTENNGSRIILTTRESNVATYVDSKSPHHQVRLLNEVDSWKLLSEKVFGEETCLTELEKLGREIADSCGGLPLAIHVIGGLLSQIERTENSWEQVARDVISAIADKEEQFSRILSLSYDHLPYYLKPCFLYMSAFPEDYEISASNLVRFWVAEGFLKQIEGKSQEETAEEHVNALIDRNLLLVSKRTITGNVDTCIMHDLLRDLCVQKACKKKFFHTMNGKTHNIQDMLSQRRVSILTSQCIEDIYGSSTGQKSLTRSLIFVGRRSPKIRPTAFSTLEMLRVLDVLKIQFSEIPQGILRLVNLRYLAFSSWNFHPGITTLVNLQTIIFHGTSLDWANVSHELFEMPNLRELVFKGMTLRCDFKQLKDLVPQKNLRTTSKLEVSANIDVVLAKFQNLKKLKIEFSYKSESNLVDLTCLQKLEELKSCCDSSRESRYCLPNVSFPVSLKSLTLSHSHVPQVCMKAVGMLPNLEYLKLKGNSFGSSEKWNPCEGEFCRLQYLILVRVDLVDWVADETHFPRLEHLKIISCMELKEIPLGIGEISTLKSITVSYSKYSASASAKKIQEEQLELGNEILQVHIWDVRSW